MKRKALILLGLLTIVLAGILRDNHYAIYSLLLVLLVEDEPIRPRKYTTGANNERLTHHNIG